MKFIFKKLFCLVVCLMAIGLNAQESNSDADTKGLIDKMANLILKKDDPNKLETTTESITSSGENDDSNEKTSRRLLEKFYADLLLLMIENDLTDKSEEDYVVGKGVKMMKALLSSKLRNYRSLFDEKQKPFKRPVKNEHRHVFIGKRDNFLDGTISKNAQNYDQNIF